MHDIICSSLGKELINLQDRPILINKTMEVQEDISTEMQATEEKSTKYENS